MKQGLTNCEQRPVVAGRIGPAKPRLRIAQAHSVRLSPAARAGANDQVFLPLGYESGYDYPLLVWLPDSSDDRFDLGRVMARLSLRNYLAVRAGGATPETCWAAIERMTDRYSVHPRRIYLVGEGDGGAAAFRIACREPSAFAGVVSVAGRFPLDEGLFSRLGDVRSLPMLLCCAAEPNGVAAPNAADVDRTLRLFHAAGGQLGLRIYPAVADARRCLSRSRAVLRDLDRWVMDDVSRGPLALAAAGV
jgi:phospholipase/carboxylesterase